jgi:hypothetical protein
VALPRDADQSSATRRKVNRYFAFLALSALNFAQRAFVNFEILALPAADMVRLRLTPLGLTGFEVTGAGCEPFSAWMAP